MPNRKKPFSNKQKKVQILQKRERKRNCSGNTSSEENEVGDAVIITTGSTKQEKSTNFNVNVAKVNQQPVSSERPKHEYDPNRYRLHFYRESKEEMKLRKEKASLPIESVPEEALEMSLESIYRPGTELDMPRRPPWGYSMTKEQLDAQEQRYFQNYVEKIFAAHQDSEDLSYFELNLETWRQLWRVMEMSDVFLVIVDLRFPVLQFPPTLYKYLTVELKKPIILILNKIDLVPPPLAIAWWRYFCFTYPSMKVVLFGSNPRPAVDLARMFKKKKPTKRSKYQICYGIRDICNYCAELSKGEVDMSLWKQRLDALEAGTDLPDKLPVPPPDSHHMDGQHVPFKDGVLTIGCIGEPNVGKSSVINALMGQKVVSVSKTPGHTKHFQTIFLAPNVRLCDCPGLVFPATAPKVLQILGGIYPISQVSDPYNVIGYLAARLPLVELLKLKHPNGGQGPFSALDICDAWALKRGFFTAKAARPDVYRAGNHLLRITLEGRICLRMYPPEYTANKRYFETAEESKRLTEELQQLEKKLHGETDSVEKVTSGDDEDSELDSTEEEIDRKNCFDSISGNNKFAALGISSD